MFAMPDTSVPKCVLCDDPSKWYCMSCGPNGFYCHTHACNHLARQYPDEFGIKPGPKEQQKQDNERTNRFLLVALFVVLLLLFLAWIWSQPSSGNSETMRIHPSTPYKSSAFSC